MSVSSNLNNDGTQVDPVFVTQAGDAIKALYYTIYSILCALCFIVLPYLYFYYEEDDPDYSLGAMLKLLVSIPLYLL